MREAVTGRPRLHPEGRYVAHNGYVRVNVGTGHPLAMRDGTIYEHRLVLRDAGVEIPAGAHVHHKNHDRTDNRLENLEVVTVEEHGHRHRTATVESRRAAGAANSRRLRAKRRDALAQGIETVGRATITHGTLTGSVSWGCACDACRETYNAWRASRRR